MGIILGSNYIFITYYTEKTHLNIPIYKIFLNDFFVCTLKFEQALHLDWHSNIFIRFSRQQLETMRTIVLDNY